MDYKVRHFQRDVIDASAQLPVVVDFRAAWCAPCKMLGPILEQLAATAQRRWKRVTVDVDAQPALAQQYRVRGIPAVKRFIDGHVVDQFSGAMPQSALVQWLGSRIPTPAQRQVTEAREHLAHGRREQARELLQAALAGEPDSRDARGLLALVLDDPQPALTLAAGLREDAGRFAAASAARVIAELLTTDPASLPAGLAQADYLQALQTLRDGNIEAALGHFLDAIVGERGYLDDGARKACVALFELPGAEYPQLRDLRRSLQRALH